jgi:hypothetical protein
MDDALNSWFAREILVHEAALVRYLTRTWSNKDDICDLRQETYIRVYEAAKTARPTFAKSFLFTTAPVDIRKQIDGLILLASHERPDPHSSLLAAYLQHVRFVRGLQPKTCEGLLLTAALGRPQRT